MHKRLSLGQQVELGAGLGALGGGAAGLAVGLPVQGALMGGGSGAFFEPKLYSLVNPAREKHRRMPEELTKL